MKLKDLSTVPYNTTAEKLVAVLCKKTQNDSALFFRVQVGYYFAKVASMMRAQILTHDRGKLPINLYAINLASSGQGKGHSTNIIEEHVINQFRERFLDETFIELSDRNLAKLALKRASRKQDVEEDDERLRVDKEFDLLGNLAFSFDSGTTAAVKQMRHKLLMANAGSMNMEIDEIGSNLLGNVDVLTTFLELFDVGKVKQKLTKNTAENTRGEEIEGRTPTNMMLFGTPAKLFNGGKVEEEFYTMLETGYARRCLFGNIIGAAKSNTFTVDEIYAMSTDKSSETVLSDLSDEIGQLADIMNFGRTLTMTEHVSKLVIAYTKQCVKKADDLGEHNEIRKAEVTHRYFKALKLAGAYAFIEGSHEITEDHLYSGIKLTEDSGDAFDQMLTRDRNYVKLAKYIASVKRDVTHVDMVEDLPFYKGSEAAKRELLTYATSWGYMHNIIIKRKFIDGIEFLSGETLELTDLGDMRYAYSTDYAHNYEYDTTDNLPFDKLHLLTNLKGHHWTNHRMLENHRVEHKAIPGFNMIVIDVDDSVSIDTVKLLMKDYTYHIHTTKRHQANVDGVQYGDRFRLVLPMSHVLKLDKEDYVDFMQNVFDWLPFDSDTQTSQRARKWETSNGQYWYNDGKLVDALIFIPKTVKCENQRAIIDNQQSMNNMERWFVNNTGTGNRSNQLIKYALMLVDSGMDMNTVQANVMALNNKLQDKMEEIEILSTVMVTARKRALAKP